jgi:hypothetical protein
LESISSRLEQELPKAFSWEDIQQIAAESEYHKRAGAKLDGNTFLQLVLFNSQSLMDDTLEDLSTILEDELSVNVSKQSIHDRFNDFAVKFLKSVFSELLSRKIPKESIVKLNTNFKRILIKDSTCFGVSEELYKLFPISDKEGNTKAAVRIQFEYDVLTGTINDLSIHPFRDQDNCDWKTTNSKIQENDLIIRDLGYMHLKAIIDLISKRNAAVLCRLDTRTDVFVKDRNNKFKKVNFAKEQQYMRKFRITSKEMDVFVGAEEHFPMRMVMFDLPEDVAAARIRKVCKERKRNGSKNIKRETIVRASMSIMLTSLLRSSLSKEKCYALYSVRWQIELLFKCWKSIVRIDKTKSVKRERFECFLYSKLLQVVLIWQFFWSVHKWMVTHKKKYLSLLKTTKALMKNLSILKCFYMEKMPKQSKKVAMLLNTIVMRCELETKKGDLPSLEIILSALEKAEIMKK